MANGRFSNRRGKK